jgi:hypothetical protein
MRQRTRSWFETDGGGLDSSLATLGSVTAVLVSTLTSVVGYLTLPAEMQIHWTLGAGPYYGPEFAPTAAVLAVFPVLLGAVALGARWVASKLSHELDDTTDGLAYAMSIVATVTVVLGVQIGLVVANL